MSTPPSPSTTAVDQLRNDDGWFTMVAVDQRESLRHMIGRGHAETVSDEVLIRFKRDVARTLTSRASGLLLDPQYGLSAATAADCPVILAADILTSSMPGGPVDTAEINTELTVDAVEAFSAHALKMLVPWLPGTRNEAIDLSAAFMERCREFGLPGVVEGVVRPRNVSEWSLSQRSEALIAAAEDLAQTRPDLYKTEVIFTDPSHITVATETSRAITELVECPWVVLSSGVPSDLFADALASACAGGASGFLAGRAVWAGATAVDDPFDYLSATSLEVLEKLINTVKENAQ